MVVSLKAVWYVIWYCVDIQWTPQTLTSHKGNPDRATHGIQDGQWDTARCKQMLGMDEHCKTFELIGLCKRDAVYPIEKKCCHIDSFHHWLHGKLSKWQLSVQLMMKIAQPIKVQKMVGIKQGAAKSQSRLVSFIMNTSTQFEINPLGDWSKNALKPQKGDQQINGWMDQWTSHHSHVHLCWRRN